MKKTLAIILFAAVMMISCTAVCYGADTADANTPLFEMLYEKAMEYSGEILSALAFVGSLIIAFTYKKGLLPLIKSALGALGSVVSALREQTENSISKSSDAIDYLRERLISTEELIESLTLNVAELSEKLKSKAESEKADERARIIIESQVDMLGEIFMTSSLPQYAKDRVGEKLATMKALLTSSEPDGE